MCIYYIHCYIRYIIMYLCRDIYLFLFISTLFYTHSLSAVSEREVLFFFLKVELYNWAVGHISSQSSLGLWSIHYLTFCIFQHLPPLTPSTPIFHPSYKIFHLHLTASDLSLFFPLEVSSNQSETNNCFLHFLTMNLLTTWNSCSSSLTSNSPGVLSL